MNEETPSKQDIQVEGILEPLPNKCAQLINPAQNGRTRPTDPFLPRELGRRFKLSPGSYICGNAVHDSRYPNPKIRFVETVDGLRVEERKKKLQFNQLTTITPNELLKLEVEDGRMTTRVADLFCPIGKGQRGLIVAPPRTGKTTLLKDMAYGISQNHPECHVMILLVDERPEEVTDFRRTTDAEIFASSNDEEIKSHIRIAELAIDRARRLVEVGRDVVLLLDSITRLARAYNAIRSSGRTMTGGLDIRALEKPWEIFA